jgi:streptogramin lyase
MVGMRRCVDGQWGPCEDMELVVEGEAGDGVARAPIIGSTAVCTGCDPSCYTTHDCPSSADEGADGLSFDGSRFDALAGGVVIGNPSKSAMSRNAWISSYASDAVNKISLITLKNEGVYRAGDNPSRTTVDSEGYVYVGNRDSGDVTKIAGELSQCIETNGVPGIQTSAGETAPGVFNVLGPNSNLVTRDECIIWQRPVGPGNGNPKALALDSRNRLWVGLNDKKTYYVMDISNGNTILGPFNMTDTPYGAAIGPNGKLWSGSTEGSIQPINTNVETPTQTDVGAVIASPKGVYGIAVDGQNRVIVASGSSVQRYNPATGTWQTGVTAGAKGVSVDVTGRVYVCGDGANAIIEHDPGDLHETRRWNVNKNPRGCSPDFSNRIWAANHGSKNVGVIDLATGTVSYINTFDVNYTYSDFLGYGFAMFTNPTGYLYRVYDSVDTCGPGVPSLRDLLRVDVSTPDTTSISFRARVADTEAGLNSAIEVPLGTTPLADNVLDVQGPLVAAGQNPRARFMRIKVILSRNGSTQSPVFRSMDLVEYCE